MKALVIPADPEQPVREVEWKTLANVQRIVGGYIEALPFPGREDVVVYVNEEGKLQGLAANERATQVLMTPGAGYRPDDFIVGDILLVGYDQSTQKSTDIPPLELDF